MSEYRYKIAMKNLELFFNTIIDKKVIDNGYIVIDKNCCIFNNNFIACYDTYQFYTENPLLGDNAIKELECVIEADMKLLNSLKTLNTTMDLSSEPNVNYYCQHNGGGSDGKIFIDISIFHFIIANLIQTFLNIVIMNIVIMKKHAQFVQ
jgi:hypothetical protein